jgi:hypothetical protein
MLAPGEFQQPRDVLLAATHLGGKRDLRPVMRDGISDDGNVRLCVRFSHTSKLVNDRKPVN